MSTVTILGAGIGGIAQAFSLRRVRTGPTASNGQRMMLRLRGAKRTKQVAS